LVSFLFYIINLTTPKVVDFISDSKQKHGQVLFSKKKMYSEKASFRNEKAMMYYFFTDAWLTPEISPSGKPLPCRFCARQPPKCQDLASKQKKNLLKGPFRNLAMQNIFIPPGY
jgi:hypothetical protein